VDPYALTIVYSPDGGPVRMLARASSESCVDGQWYVSERDDIGLVTEIDLCPTHCEVVKTTPEASVFAIYQCMEML
jgi:hypothetical protein